MKGLLLWSTLAAVSVGTICAASTQVAKQPAPERNAGPVAANAVSAADLAVAQDFLKALLARDLRVLRQYGPGFFDGGKLDQVTSDFLYVPDPKHKTRSVNQIAADGDLQIVLIRQKSGIVTVFYVPKKYQAGLKKRSFLEDEWMKKYFACEFSTTKRQWALYYNFCFCDTGGPYEAEEGKN